MESLSPFIVALDHPSLEFAVDRFADELRDERRYFGRNATTKPFPSLINRLTSTGGLRLGAMIDGRLIAMARIEHHGDTAIAVLADWRGKGIGGALLRASVVRAGQRGHEVIRLRSTRRSRAVAGLGRAVGATTVDQGGGRVDLLFATAGAQRLA